jgi:hypothetical protein
VFIEQAIALRERLFLTGRRADRPELGVRHRFQNVLYPKASLSWLASEEGFFPRPAGSTSPAVRAAYGESGVQPGPNDALRFFEVGRSNVRATDIAADLHLDRQPEPQARADERDSRVGFAAKLFAADWAST